MRLLILGGTWFLGRTIAEHAIEAGYQVTTFSRGRSGRDVPGTIPVRGRREDPDDVARLASSGRWDVVVDTSGYTPETVGLAARMLRDRADRYVLISTVNAYRGWPTEPLTDQSQVYEDAGDGARPVPSAAKILAPGGIAYGQGKAAGERALARSFAEADRLVLRPGVILGPYEYIGRLPWLLRRMDRGGVVLAAGSPSRPIQPVDVRDLSEFVLHAAKTGRSGAMNVTAPLGHATYSGLLESCRSVTGGHCELVWVADDWLAVQDVTPWSEIPLWRTTAGAWRVTSERALAAGLTCRPLPETVADTWAWLRRENPVPHQRAAEIGLDAVKEEQLLAAWREHAAGC
jgi:nucleoside-diphosphate-sugar epimerase